MLAFGGGDPGASKLYMIALAGFLMSKTPNTAKTYGFAIREFFELWNWRCPENITVAEAAYYKKWLRSRDLSDGTISTRLAACTAFFDFLARPPDTSGKPLLTSNPFRLVPRKDITPSPYGRSKPVDRVDLQKMLRALPTDPIGRRDYAVLVFLAFTGRRRAEAANLRVRDLDIETEPRSYRIKVKGGKVKQFHLPTVAYNAMRKHWITSNRLSSLRPDSAVFGPMIRPGSYMHLDPHRCMNPNQIGVIVKRAAVTAGISPDRVHTHGIRHAFAHDLDEAGEVIQSIQQQLGQENPNTTAIYLGRMKGPPKSVEDLLNQVRAKAAAQAAAAIDDG